MRFAWLLLPPLLITLGSGSSAGGGHSQGPLADLPAQFRAHPSSKRGLIIRSKPAAGHQLVAFVSSAVVVHSKVAGGARTYSSQRLGNPVLFDFDGAPAVVMGLGDPHPRPGDSRISYPVSDADFGIVELHAQFASGLHSAVLAAPTQDSSAGRELLEPGEIGPRGIAWRAELAEFLDRVGYPGRAQNHTALVAAVREQSPTVHALGRPASNHGLHLRGPAALTWRITGADGGLHSLLSIRTEDVLLGPIKAIRAAVVLAPDDTIDFGDFELTRVFLP